MNFSKNYGKRRCSKTNDQECVVFFDDRRGCNFSHELDSERNLGILREHELDSLSREELCTLLMQSDNTLLPPVSRTTYRRYIQRSL